MNNTTNPDPSQPHDPGQREETGNPPSSSRMSHCAFDPLCSAVDEGIHRAKAAAEKAVPKVKAAVAGATYWLGYGVSFATVFSYTIVKELAPEILKAGCRAGAQAGQRSAVESARKLRTRSNHPDTSPSPGINPSEPAPQPGGA